MDEIKWLDGLHQKDSKIPSENVEGEARYTLYQRDFLQMPDVDFGELAEIDSSIRALLN